MLYVPAADQTWHSGLYCVYGNRIEQTYAHVFSRPRRLKFFAVPLLSKETDINHLFSGFANSEESQNGNQDIIKFEDD